MSAFKQIVECDPNVTWTVAKAMEHFNVSKRSVDRYVAELGWTTKLGVIIPTGKDIKQDDIPF